MYLIQAGKTRHGQVYRLKKIEMAAVAEQIIRQRAKQDPAGFFGREYHRYSFQDFRRDMMAGDFLVSPATQNAKWAGLEAAGVMSVTVTLSGRTVATLETEGLCYLAFGRMMTAEDWEHTHHTHIRAEGSA